MAVVYGKTKASPAAAGEVASEVSRWGRFEQSRKIIIGMGNGTEGISPDEADRCIGVLRSEERGR